MNQYAVLHWASSRLRWHCLPFSKPSRWLAFFCLTTLMPLSAGATPWEKFKHPTTAQPQAIGSYSNGCLAGASVLPAQGEGYQRVRAERGRYYGHESMIAFLEELSGKAHKLKLGNLLVSDIAMPRGGRFRSGHASHQTGLDADIWLTTLAQPATEEELSSLQPLPMVDLKAYRILPENWSENQANLIQLAAADERVARIFVHPVIKEQLCAVQWTDRDWLRKVRPWWGHYYHFHVRLHCPQGNRDCKEQRPPPSGDGCGAELASWKPKPASERKVAAAKPAKKRPPLIPVQHPGCMAMLNGPVETQDKDHYAAGEPIRQSSQRAQ